MFFQKRFQPSSELKSFWAVVKLLLIAFAMSVLFVLFLPSSSIAEQSVVSARHDMNFFNNKLTSTNIFDRRKKKLKVSHVPNEEETSEVEIVDGSVSDTEETQSTGELQLDSSDTKLRAEPLEVIDPSKPSASRSPDEELPLRIEPTAPSSIRDGITALVSGDRETAQAYAKQWTRQMTDMMFTVREWSNLVVKSLYDEGKIDEEEYYRAPEMVDQAMAQARDEMGSVFSPTHKDAMRRIKADPKGEVEVLYFFSLNCKFCRTMAPDVERLHQSLKNDPRVRLTAVTLGRTPDAWLDSYRKYTGLTVPMAQGEKLARQLQIAFVPAVVVVTSNSNQAYVKSGEQSFENMYEFVRVAQGLSGEMSPEVKKLKDLNPGETIASETNFGAGSQEQKKKKFSRF